MPKESSSCSSQSTANKFSRRTLLKGVAASGVVAATGPFYNRLAMASSGEVNVFAWGDYVQENMTEAFEKKALHQNEWAISSFFGVRFCSTPAG